MARASREKAEANRAQILSTAGRLFRQKGFEATSIAEIATAAGLTHGGIYSQFASKDELAAEVCRVSFDDTVRRWKERRRISATAQEALRAIVTAYLREENRDALSPDCAVVSFSVDVSRTDSDIVLKTYEEGMNELVSVMDGLLEQGEADNVSQRETTLFIFSALLGALTLSRSLKRDPLSDQILDVVKKNVLEIIDLRLAK